MPAEEGMLRSTLLRRGPGRVSQAGDGGTAFKGTWQLCPSLFPSTVWASVCVVCASDRAGLGGGSWPSNLGFLEKGPRALSLGSRWTGWVFYGVWGSPSAAVSVKCQEAKLV